MERIPQSVALRVPLKAYLTSDHVSPATGKTIAVVISKNGAAFGNPSGGATNATEIANGWYYVDLSTTDTGTLGPLIVRGTSTGVDDVESALDVAPPHNAGFDGVPAVVAGANGGLPLGDAAGKVALQADQPVNTTKINGASQTARDIGATLGAAGAGLTALGDTRIAHLDADVSTRSTYAGGDTSGTTTLLSRIASALTITTGKVDVNDKTGFSLSAAGVQALWDALTSALTTVGSVGKLLVDNLNATVSSRMATFSLPANFSSFEIDGSGRVDVAKVAGTAQTARDIGASVLLSAGTGTGQLDFTSGIVKSNLAQILGTALTETAGLIAGAFKKLFNVASPTLTCLGVDQTGDNYARLGAPAGASVSADVAAAKADTAAIKTKTDSLTFTNAGKVDANTLQVGGTVQTGRDLGASVLLSPGTGAGQVSLSAGKVSLIAADITAIEGGTWDVALSGHLTSGTTGAALNGAGSAGDPWTTPLPGAYGAGTAGNIVGTKLDAAVSSRSTYAGGDTTGTTTLLARLTSTRAALLDNLDAAVSGVAAAVWAAGGRTLTGFGTLVADVATAVWGAVTRSLTDKAGFTLSAAYDAAKTAGDATAASQTSILAKLPAALSGGRMDASVGAYQAGQVPAKVADLPAVPTTDAIVLAILQRKITLDAITGEFVIWDAAGTSEVARLTPTTDAAALPIVGMRPSV